MGQDPGGLDIWNQLWGDYVHELIENDFREDHPNFSAEVWRTTPATGPNNSGSRRAKLDLLDEKSGYFYEIEPWTTRRHGLQQIADYEVFGLKYGFPLYRSKTPDRSRLIPSKDFAFPYLWIYAWHDEKEPALILYTWIFLLPFGQGTPFGPGDGASEEQAIDDFLGGTVGQCLSKVLN